MNELPCHRRNQAVTEPAAAASRHIIRLQNDADCVETALMLQDRFGPDPLSGSIMPLPLINGLSCPAPLSPALLDFPHVASVEEDWKTAAVHNFFAMLPVGGAFQRPRSHAAGKPFVPWGIRRIQAPAAWKRSSGDKIRIGVIDTGVDFNHPDLQSNIGGGINLIHRHLPPTDDNGHGTHISGTIAASARNGMKGVAPYATIYAVKAFDHNGSSYVTDIVRGIEWCVRNRMHIINMSFGMKTRSPALEAAVRLAAREGVIIVASAGNEGRKGFVDYPARFKQTIGVGATNRRNRIASFSNRGSEIDIYAPGEKITSTWLNGKYQELSGTSMATSHVSGVIALLLSLEPGLSPKALIAYLQKNATPMASAAKQAGYLGEVNAAKTLGAFLRSRGKSRR